MGVRGGGKGLRGEGYGIGGENWGERVIGKG